MKGLHESLWARIGGFSGPCIRESSKKAGSIPKTGHSLVLRDIPYVHPLQKPGFSTLSRECGCQETHSLCIGLCNRCVCVTCA